MITKPFTWARKWKNRKFAKKPLELPFLHSKAIPGFEENPQHHQHYLRDLSRRRHDLHYRADHCSFRFQWVRTAGDLPFQCF